MSSVRMCDKCERVFSENEEGWQTANLNTVEYDDHGGQVTVTLRQDLCSDCAVPSPRRNARSSDRTIAMLEQQNDRIDRLTEQIEQVGEKPKPRAG